jgi:hypothetical protein
MPPFMGLAMRVYLTFLATVFLISPVFGDDPQDSKVSDEAIAEMRAVQAAYGHLKSLQVSGTITSTMSHGRGKSSNVQKFTGAFSAPNFFRVEIGVDRMGQGEQICGCNGAVIYSEHKDPLQRMASDIPTDKLQFMRSMLLTEGLEKCLPISIAVNSEAALQLVRELSTDVVHVKLEADQQIGDKSYDVVVRTSEMTGRKTTLLIDPQTHLIRRETEETLMPGVSIVRVTDYKTTDVDKVIPKETFRWSAPKEWVDPDAKRDADPSTQPVTKENAPAVF